MFENVPLSAYALCYGPLALTIIGFIVFAALTDANARRTYLRRDPKLPPGQVPPIAEPFEGVTPSGVRVSVRPPTDPVIRDIDLPPAPVSPSPTITPPVAPKPDTIPDAPVSGLDVETTEKPE